jgi:signal transduction histidine kinase
VGDNLCIEVVDDGKGIAQDVTASGLKNLRQRAEDAGGSFSVEAQPSGGTKLRWCAPLP